MADLTKMSVEELHAEQQRISDKREALIAQGAAVQAEIDDRALQARLANTFTDEERSRLAQFVQPEGVASKERVNG